MAVESLFLYLNLLNQGKERYFEVSWIMYFIDVYSYPARTSDWVVVVVFFITFRPELYCVGEDKLQSS